MVPSAKKIVPVPSLEDSQVRSNWQGQKPAHPCGPGRGLSSCACAALRNLLEMAFIFGLADDEPRIMARG